MLGMYHLVLKTETKIINIDFITCRKRYDQSRRGLYLSFGTL